MGLLFPVTKPLPGLFFVSSCDSEQPSLIMFLKMFKYNKQTKANIGRKFPLFFYFFYSLFVPVLPSCPLSLFCQEMSVFIRARTGTYDHTSVKYPPLVSAFCPHRAQTQYRPTGFFTSFKISRSTNRQGSINNLWLRLRLITLANLNGNV